MANQTAKTAKVNPALPQRAPAPSTASPVTPGPKASPGSEPNSVLGRSLAAVTPDMRRAMIAEAAYFIAQQRGFGCGREMEDWLLAEEQVDAVLTA
jgi:Protein of unknown function (DUF2934)